MPSALSNLLHNKKQELSHIFNVKLWQCCKAFGDFWVQRQGYAERIKDRKSEQNKLDYKNVRCLWRDVKWTDCGKAGSTIRKMSWMTILKNCRHLRSRFSSSSPASAQALERTSFCQHRRLLNTYILSVQSIHFRIFKYSQFSSDDDKGWINLIKIKLISNSTF